MILFCHNLATIKEVTTETLITGQQTKSLLPNYS